jgi:hypothetical protein
VGPKTQALIGVLDELAAVLASDEEEHWSGWMTAARTRLLNSDYSGIDYLMSAYGGMGSLNDHVLGQGYQEGVFAWKPGHVELNKKFNALRTKAWEIANEVKQDQP